MSLPRRNLFLCAVMFSGVFGVVTCEPKTLPAFPQQFSATITTIAHLVDRTSDYPPWKQVLQLEYDYQQKRARVTGVEGFHVNKIFLQRYDTKNEYLIRTGDFPECKRSYLSEEMPLPALPLQTAEYEGTESIDGVVCDHWVESQADSRIHIYMTTADGAPFQLIDEYVASDTKLSEPVMTYMVRNFSSTAPPEQAFDIPEPYSHKECERHIGGHPFLHLFSSYLQV